MTLRQCSLALLAAACLTLKLNAQIVEATNCVYREGDDPQWAQPAYDDSGWDKSPPQGVAKSRFLWRRCRIDASPLRSRAPLFLQIRSPFAWTVSMDGIAAGSFGNLQTGSVTLDLTQLVPIPSELEGRSSYLVAIRMARASPNFDIIGPDRDLALGTEDALQLRRFRRIQQDVSLRWLPSVMSPLIFAAAMLLLVLSRADPNRREVFWLGIVAGGFALKRMVDLIAVLQLALPSNVALTLLLLGSMGASTEPWLFYSLRKKPVPRLFAAIFIVRMGSTILEGLPAFGLDSYFWFSVTSQPVWTTLGLVSPALLWASAVLAYWPIGKLNRRDLTLFITGLVWMLGSWAVFALQLPGLSSAASIVLGRQIQTVAYIPSILVFIFVLASQFRRVHHERDDLTADMQAARVVQRRLVPERIPPVAGFQFAAAYLPAKEVGDDFYRIFAVDSGAILVVVGDVSGKGLMAAMTVSVLVGAMEAMRSRRPGEFLAELNNVAKAHLESGFVTCCAALITPAGDVTIANAGHPAPYCDGHEAEVEAGLPLGIAPGVEYTESVTRGERFTFVSDGVVEAENTQRELFGFDRTREISGKSAQEIAEAAKAWGQNDDITVVTVRRNA